MPGRGGYASDDRRRWPVKILRGTFSANKRWLLEARYNRRHIRLEFRPA